MNSLLIAQNIIKRIFKNPKSVIALLIFPVVLIIIVVAALRGSESDLKIGIVNLDQGFYSERIVNYISKDNVSIITLNENEIEKQVKGNKVDFAIVLPQDLSAHILSDERVGLSFYTNKQEDLQGYDQKLNDYLLNLYTTTKTAKMISSQNTERFVKDMMTKIENKDLNVSFKLAGREEGSYEGLMVDPAIGFSVMFIMILIFTTIGFILEDKKKLVLARMYVSPIKEWEIILGNLLGSLTLGLIQLIPIVAALSISFHIASFTKIINLFVILFCFLIAVIGIGIGISGFIKNTFNPSILIAVVITPSSILGGALISESMLPDIVNKIGYIVPQKWVMLAIEKVLAGDSLLSVGINLVIILMFGVLFSTFGLKTLRPLSE